MSHPTFGGDNRTLPDGTPILVRTDGLAVCRRGNKTFEVFSGKPSSALDCVDCGMDTCAEWYMVSFSIWAEAFGLSAAQFRDSPDVILCVGCLEKRLGRRLVASDFLKAGGELGQRSLHLQSRLLARS
ncbi:MAG TPA: hypothetical protein VMS00_06245 [Acidimicrobiales bacterium]|nr:hypothetical protein [Acidimicrobiales bacterium]